MPPGEHGQADDLLEQARLARSEGDTDRALECAQAALELTTQPGQRPARLAALNLQAQLERDSGHTEQALALYGGLVRELKAEEDALSRAHAIRHIADIHCDQGQLGKAAAAYASVLQIHRDAGDTASLQMANALRGYAVLMGQLDDPERAKVFWSEARVLYAQEGLEAGVAECDQWLSELPRDEDAG